MFMVFSLMSVIISNIQEGLLWMSWNNNPFDGRLRLKANAFPNDSSALKRKFYQKSSITLAEGF